MNKQGRNIVYGFLNPLNQKEEETLMRVEVGPEMQKQFDGQNNIEHPAAAGIKDYPRFLR
jgi:hypothetical protein